MAQKALEQITSSTGFVPRMLYLCALDAQSQDRKDLGFVILRKIIREYDEEWMTEEAKSEIRLPVIFRYSDSNEINVDV